MKNVLFVLPFFPYPFISGGHQAIFNGINAVRDNVNVFITYCEYPEYQMIAEKAEFAKATDNKVSVLPFILPSSSKGDRLLNIIYRIKYRFKRLISGKNISPKHDDYGEWNNQFFDINGPFLDHINALIEQYNIDIVQCEMLEMSPVVFALPQQVKKIFVEHEIGFVRKQLCLDVKGDKSALGAVQLGMNKSLEVELLNKFDVVVTLSSIDTNKLIEAGVTTKIHTSFAIVNSSIRKSISSHFSNTLVFIGPEWHPSNKAGLLWFLENCWDMLMSSGQYELNVIGNWRPETAKEIESKYSGVHFLGFVKDLTSVMQNTIMIVPITIGSGIRMKILEACSFGIPFVSTSVGMEGLPFTTEKDCLIADTPEMFVQSIISLKDDNKRKMIIDSAQSIVQSYYSLNSLALNRMLCY